MRWSILTSVLALLPVSFAASNNTSRATYIYNGTGSAVGNDLIWSIEVDKPKGDVYFHIMAPQSGSWVGIGFGEKMAGSLMMIAYPSSNGTGITISPRISTGHTEPTYAQSIVVEKRFDSGLTTPNSIDTTNQIMYIDGVCRNCTTWNGGSLDLSNTNAPFIFAAGPGINMASDDPAAPLKRHSFYGYFTMNMPAATVQSNASVPLGPYVAGNSTATGVQKDNDFASGAHAALMSLSFLIIFPLGSLILRIFDRVILHIVVQMIGVFFIVVSFGIGCFVSGQYNRSKGFNSAHQIIGLLLVMGVLAQLGLGIVGHRVFKKTGTPAKFGKVHLIMGPILIIAAAINGGLGLSLGQMGAFVTRYALIVVAIFIVFVPLRITAHICVRRRQRNRVERAAGNYNQGGYQYPQFVAPKEPHSQAVPLQPYPSTDSVPPYHGQAQQTRPMF